MTVEPACWSWLVPPLRDVAAEIDLILAAQESLPGDRQYSRGGLELVYRSAEVMRWDEFHSGLRPAAGGLDAEPRCAMCGRSWGRMVPDHDHSTGLHRGTLCSGCNISEGRGSSDLAAAYRERNPATILGYQAYYFGGYGWRIGWWNDVRYARRLTGNPDWQPLR